MPEDLMVRGSSDLFELQSLDADWYEDVELPGLGQHLLHGIEWNGKDRDGGSYRHSLSGREIYVLAPHSMLRGYVTTPRLVLGESHVVLCVSGRLAEVRAAIEASGSPAPTLLEHEVGVPEGWVGLSGVVPTRPVAPSPTGDILDALRPLAEVEVALIGGIRIDRQTWLRGFPPRIELHGDKGAIDRLTIDDREALPGVDGFYTVPGWDETGTHVVWCTSSSKVYTIADGAEYWEPWDAYSWSLGNVGVDDEDVAQPAICGVLVRPPRVPHAGRRGYLIAASNPVLLGARPGEYMVCTPRGDVRSGVCIDFPWFEPIWALPLDSLHCDKRKVRLRLIGPVQPVVLDDEERTGSWQDPRRRMGRRDTHAWIRAILNASAKGLRTSPESSEVGDLWKAYRDRAKGLRRGQR